MLGEKIIKKWWNAASNHNKHQVVTTVSVVSKITFPQVSGEMLLIG